MEELLKLRKEIIERIKEIESYELIVGDLYDEYMDLKQQLVEISIDIADAM